MFLPDLASRQKHLQAQVPGIVDLTLDEVLTWTKATQKKVAGAQVVFVRSSEIDAAGENTENRYARRIMEGTVGDVARCLSKLVGAGIENAVVTADHGHLYFAVEREEAMRNIEPGRRDFTAGAGLAAAARLPPGPSEFPAQSSATLPIWIWWFPASISVFKSGRRSRLPPRRGVAAGTRHPGHYRPTETRRSPKPRRML